MTDRIDLAHAKRCAIHGWIKQRESASMAEICVAFPDIPYQTVRKTVQRLVAFGSVLSQGKSIATRYRAIGDVIDSAEQVRARMRTGHANLLHRYSRDRIARAWAMRCAIHEWIAAHPMARMNHICAAFPETPIATVQKHVRALCKKQNVSMHGRSVAARYSASTTAIYEQESVREKLRSNGRAVGLRNAVAEDETPPLQHAVPGRFVNCSNRRRAEQRGLASA